MKILVSLRCSASFYFAALHVAVEKCTMDSTAVVCTQSIFLPLLRYLIDFSPVITADIVCRTPVSCGAVYTARAGCPGSVRLPGRPTKRRQVLVRCVFTIFTALPGILSVILSKRFTSVAAKNAKCLFVGCLRKRSHASGWLGLSHQRRNVADQNSELP